MSLAALYVAALAADLHKDAVMMHMSMSSSTAALQLMPCMLLRLLRQSTWQEAHMTRMIVERLFAIHGHASCNAQMQHLTLSCLVALHDDVDVAHMQRLSAVTASFQDVHIDEHVDR
jgi:hypothetical protein